MSGVIGNSESINRIFDFFFKSGQRSSIVVDFLVISFNDYARHKKKKESI